MAGYLARIATGPTLSKDLDRDQARDGMDMILRGEVDRAQAAVFLIALRMKRETHAELCGVLDALRASAAIAHAPVDDLVDMAEPYNGYVRHLPAAPFVPAVLAACGVPCVLHGCRDAGPKWGLTAHRVLAAAGVDVGATSAQAAQQIATTGWAYVDLPQACAALDQLAGLRRLIVKRPCLSLLEKLIAPVRARAGGRTHLWVGYAHREYPEILAALARAAGYASMLAVRGVEGGVTTTLSGSARGFRCQLPGGLEPASAAPASDVVDSQGHETGSPDAVLEEAALHEITLEEIALDARTGLGQAAAERAPALPADAPARADDRDANAGPHANPGPARLQRWAEVAAEAGMAALSGASGSTADMLALSAAAVLWHLGRVDDIAAGVASARAALRDGSARARLEAYRP